MAERGRNVARKKRSGGAYTASRLPTEPVPSNMNPTIDELDDKGRLILSRSGRAGPTLVGALGGTPNSSEELTGINISQREGDRIQRSEYKMPKKKQIKPKPRPDVGAIERGNRAAKRTAQDLATQNFEEGGRIADVRDDPSRGKTY